MQIVLSDATQSPCAVTQMWLVASLINCCVLLCLCAATGLAVQIVLSAPVVAAQKLNCPLVLPFCYSWPGFTGITGRAAIFNDSLVIFSPNINSKLLDVAEVFDYKTSRGQVWRDSACLCQCVCLSYLLVCLSASLSSLGCVATFHTLWIHKAHVWQWVICLCK